MILSRRLIGGVAAAAVIGGGLAATGVALAAPTTTSFAACVSQVGGVLYNVTTNGTPKCVAKDKIITWNQNGPTGPAGPAGPQGAAGAPGATGPQGVAGPDGTDGTDGSDGTNVLTSSGAPTGSCTTGDADIDITTGDVWKCDAGGWTATGSSIEGPQGAPGPQGAAGPQGPAGPAGTAAGFGTNTQQAQAGTGAECTLGQIILSAGAVANGVPANGQIMQISQNEALFALLGTLYGGDGVTTFALPNLGAAAPNGLTYSICTEGVFPARS